MQNPDDENPDIEKWKKFKKKGLHFVHININNLLPKIDELRHLTKTTDVSVVGISETKFDNSVSSGEFEIEGHNLLRFDRSWRGGVAYVNKFLEHNYKHSFCKNTKSILTNIFLPKTKPVLVGILYRPPDKNDFVKNL